MYYELAIKVTIQDKKGNDKEVKERYITDCELFAECEQKGLELTNGEGDVCEIRRSNVIEIIKQKENDEESYFKAKVVSISIAEDGSEKETTYFQLVAAKDVKQATERVLEALKQGLDDMRLDAINKTKILSII